MDNASHPLLLLYTEREQQFALDRAAASIITEFGVRGGLQQCEECREWAVDANLEYICQAHLIPAQEAAPPSAHFTLKTRYPYFVCPQGCSEQPKYADGGEHEHHVCPVHVQAVYELHGSDITTMTKGFILTCPDCKYSSPILDTPKAVLRQVEQHLNLEASAAAAAAAVGLPAQAGADPYFAGATATAVAAGSTACPRLHACYERVLYSHPAAFGAVDNTNGPQASTLAAAAAERSVEPEQLAKHLLARIAVCAAVHITAATNPTAGLEAAANLGATAAAAAGGHYPTMPVTQPLPAAASNFSSSSSLSPAQLLPWGEWAMQCLTDGQLLLTANWARPRLASTATEAKASLLDRMLSPPLRVQNPKAAAAAGSEAGYVRQKLAAVLKRLRQRHIRNHTVLQQQQKQQQQQGSTAVGRAAAAAGGWAAAAADKAAAGVAAAGASGQSSSINPSTFSAEQLLAELLSQDCVFKHYPEHQRVQEFLQQAAGSSIHDLTAAMNSKGVSYHVTICAVCGSKGTKNGRQWQLNRCSSCVVCLCQTCSAGAADRGVGSEHAAAAAGGGGGGGAAAADGDDGRGGSEAFTCPWCRDHSSRVSDAHPLAVGISADCCMPRLRRRQSRQTTTPPAAPPAPPAPATPAAQHCWGSPLPSSSRNSSSTSGFIAGSSFISKAQLNSVAAEFQKLTGHQLTEEQKGIVARFKCLNRWRCVIPPKHKIPPGWLEIEVERPQKTTGHRDTDAYYFPPEGKTSPVYPTAGIRSGPDIEKYMAAQQRQQQKQGLPQRDPAQPDSAQPGLAQPGCTRPDQAQPDQAPPGQAPPDRTQPDQAEPEPSHAQPICPQPDQAQPDQAEPSHAQQHQAQPDPAQLNQPRPSRSQPVHAQPVHAWPDPAQPDQAQPGQAQLSHAQPVSAQPDQAQPDQAQPDQAQPDQDRPDPAQPSYIQPVSAQLVRGHSDQAQPDHARSSHAQPVCAQPGQVQPDKARQQHKGQPTLQQQAGQSPATERAPYQQLQQQLVPVHPSQQQVPQPPVQQFAAVQGEQQQQQATTVHKQPAQQPAQQLTLQQGTAAAKDACLADARPAAATAAATQLEPDGIAGDRVHAAAQSTAATAAAANAAGTATQLMLSHGVTAAAAGGKVAEPPLPKQQLINIKPEQTTASCHNNTQHDFSVQVIDLCDSDGDLSEQKQQQQQQEEEEEEGSNSQDGEDAHMQLDAIDHLSRSHPAGQMPPQATDQIGDQAAEQTADQFPRQISDLNADQLPDLFPDQHVVLQMEQQQGQPSSKRPTQTREAPASKRQCRTASGSSAAGRPVGIKKEPVLQHTSVYKEHGQQRQQQQQQQEGGLYCHGHQQQLLQVPHEQQGQEQQEGQEQQQQQPRNPLAREQQQAQQQGDQQQQQGQQPDDQLHQQQQDQEPGNQQQQHAQQPADQQQRQQGHQPGNQQQQQQHQQQHQQQRQGAEHDNHQPRQQQQGQQPGGQQEGLRAQARQGSEQEQDNTMQQQQRLLSVEDEINTCLMQLMLAAEQDSAANVVLGLQEKKLQLVNSLRTGQHAAGLSSAAANGGTHSSSNAAAALEVLLQILKVLLQLNLDNSRAVLLHCLGSVCLVPFSSSGSSAAAAAAGPETVLDLLIAAWVQEVTLTGCRADQAAAAAAGPVAKDHTGSQSAVTAAGTAESVQVQRFTAGLCYMVLQLMGCAVSSTTGVPSVGDVAVADESSLVPESEQLVQQLMQGTTLLFNSHAAVIAEGTTAAAAATIPSNAWNFQACFWRRTVWYSLQKMQTSTGTAAAEALHEVCKKLASQLQEMQQYLLA